MPEIFFIQIIFVIAAMAIVVFLVDPSRWHQVLGDWGRKLGYYDFAIEQYSSSIHLDGNRAGAFNSRGVTRYNQGQYAEAINDYNRAIGIDPQYALAFKNRALALLMIGNSDEAKRDYVTACKLGRCVDLSHLCSELKLCCDMGECTGIQAAISVGLCTAQ